MGHIEEEMRDYEAGFMDADDAIRLFQELVDMGLVWRLSERYQHTARALLEAGMIFPAKSKASVEDDEEAFEDPALFLLEPEQDVPIAG